MNRPVDSRQRGNNMQIRKVALSVALVLGTVAGVGSVATVANAAVEYPSGGTWYYGADGTKSYSHYYNNTKTHKATACGAYDASGWCEYSGWKTRGVAAIANQPVKISGNTAHWDVQ